MNCWKSIYKLDEVSETIIRHKGRKYRLVLEPDPIDRVCHVKVYNNAGKELHRTTYNSMMAAADQFVWVKKHFAERYDLFYAKHDER